jgi:Ras GTPase-activating-like protein IQGAP2/3
MNGKRASYGTGLGPAKGRKLGGHLPRIASGDGNDARDEESASLKSRPVASNLNRSLYSKDLPLSPGPPSASANGELVFPGLTSAADVPGMPRRLRFARQSPAAPSPTPSSRLGLGFWADTQRHLLQAYEYLCHVGEAQQWIEGCLDSELGFGVVELEEGLRNGVVLARLARVWEGEAVVKKIFEVIL